MTIEATKHGPHIGDPARYGAIPMASLEGEQSLNQRGRHLGSAGGLGPRFRVLFLGQAVSLLGNYVAYLTLPLLVLDIVGSAESAVPFSITYALETLPTLVFGLLGGVILDRVNLRFTMIVADLVRAAAFFYLASTVGDAQLATVFAVSFLVGSFSAAWENALFSILPQLVPRDRLATANGRIAATQQITFALGPVLAGAMALMAGPGPGLWFNGGTFIVSALALFLMGHVPRTPSDEEEGRGFIEGTLNGLRFLVGERRLRDSTIAAAAANLVFGFIEGTFLVMATIVLGTTSDIQIGVLIAVFGLGGAAGAGMADRVIRWLGLGRTMTGGLAIMALAMALLVFSRFGAVALVLAFVMFLGIGLVNVPIATIRQIYTPPAMLGRVITGSRALSWGTLPIGALLGAFFADQIDYTAAVRATPLLLVAVAVWLVTTPLWRDTFGPTYRFRERETGDDSVD